MPSSRKVLAAQSTTPLYILAETCLERILEEIGIHFLNEEAKRVLSAAGCDVDAESSRVRMDRAFVMEQVDEFSGLARRNWCVASAAHARAVRLAEWYETDQALLMLGRSGNRRPD